MNYDLDDRLRSLNSGDESSWPAAFRFENFKYDISRPCDARLIIISDMNIALGFLICGKIPPINFCLGFNICLDALSDILIAESKA